MARGGSSKAEGVHFGLFVGVALAGIAEAVVEAAGLFCQCPDEALARRKRLWPAFENSIVEGAPGIDPLPALL